MLWRVKHGLLQNQKRSWISLWSFVSEFFSYYRILVDCVSTTTKYPIRHSICRTDMDGLPAFFIFRIIQTLSAHINDILLHYNDSTTTISAICFVICTRNGDKKMWFCRILRVAIGMKATISYFRHDIKYEKT